MNLLIKQKDMHVKNSTWFETVIRYRKMSEDGTEKAVSETYCVNAVSFTEAEKKSTDYISQYVSGEYTVMKEARAIYREVLLSDDTKDEKYYKSRVSLITLDENSRTEKKQSSTLLVQAESIDKAKDYVNEHFKGGMVDYELSSVSESKVLDVIE